MVKSEPKAPAVKAEKKQPAPKKSALDNIEDSYWMIESLKHRGHYLYIQNNKEANAQLWKGDPGNQGHFEVTKKDDGSMTFYSRGMKSYYYMTRWDHRNCRADPTVDA